jgi:hypothetical protein
MSFLHLFALLPLLVFSIRVVKEIHQVLVQLRLILFDDGQVIASIGMHTGAPLLLRVHRIGTDAASFHERRVNQRSGSTDLLFFTLNRSLRQDDPALALIEGEQMRPLAAPRSRVRAFRVRFCHPSLHA